MNGKAVVRGKKCLSGKNQLEIPLWLIFVGFPEVNTNMHEKIKLWIQKC